MKAEHWLIVTDSTRRCLLNVSDPSEAGWTLPSVESEGGYAEGVGRLLVDVHTRYGLEAVVRRFVRLPGADSVPSRFVFVLETRGPNWNPPPEARWVGREEFCALAIAPPELRSVLEEWLDEAEGAAPPPFRPPWTQTGWLDGVIEWMSARLRERNLVPLGPPVQVKTWSISCVLRQPIVGGDVFFKAVPAVFAQEPRLTEQLARRAPDCLPDVLATDAKQGWLLLRGLTGKTLGNFPQSAWEQAARRFARLQVELVPDAALLRAWGCVERPLSALPAQLETLLSELQRADVRALYGVTEAQAEQVHALLPALTARCAALAACGLPETLVHGDLHGGNIFWHDHRPVLFDWSDGALAPPFFDLLVFRADLPDGKDPQAQCDFRDAYLEPWRSLVPHERLLAAWNHALALAPVYHALSYRTITQHNEAAAQWELGSGVGQMLKMLLPKGSAHE